MNIPHSLFDRGQNRFRSITAINSDIDDELEFHIHCKIDELIEYEGLDQDEAERLARRAFGNQAAIRRQCRRIHYGYRIWQTRALILGLAAACIAIGWLSLQLGQVRAKNSDLLSQINAPMVHLDWASVAGSVCDEQGTPIPETDLLVVVKRWPEGGYSQQAYSAKTDGDGKFCIDNVVPANESYAVAIAAVRPGFAFQSNYQENMIEDGIVVSVEPVHFRLVRTTEMNGIVTDQDGTPMAGVTVYPHRRFGPGFDQLVYGNAAPPIYQVTDQSGEVDLSYFEPGDQVEISVRPDGGSWQSCRLTIDDHFEPIRLKIREQDFAQR